MPRKYRPLIEWSSYKLGRESDEEIARRVRIDYPSHETVTADTVRQARMRMGIRLREDIKPKGDK